MRVLNVVVATVLAAQAVVVAVLLVQASAELLPVTAEIGGGVLIASVNPGVAAVVLLAFSAICRSVAVVWPRPVVRWIEWSQVSAVVVFLVAQLNGIHDIAALVGLYALTAGSSLFLVLHEVGEPGRSPFIFGAAIAIVPWGVIAFYQVGAMAVGAEPANVVRVLTIVMLLLASAYWYDMRLAKLKKRVVIAERAHVILVALTVSILAWTVLTSWTVLT